MKKIMISSVAAFALLAGFAGSASAVSATEIYTPATGFLKYGSGMGAKVSQMSNVMAAQKALNVCTNSSLVVDGKFGKNTTGVFKTFQASKGIAQDGVIGSITAGKLADCSVGTTGEPTTSGSSTLSGGAGDATITETSTDVETTVNEGATDVKVHGFKVEADGSDVALTAVKLSLTNLSMGTDSKRLNHYADKVSVWMGSKEVGSEDVSDFTKTGNVYTKSITLSNAIVKEGSSHKQTFYVALDAVEGIDSNDFTANWEVTVDPIRYNDATGAILTSSYSEVSNFGFTSLAASGDVKVVVSKDSSSPLAQDVTVSDSSSTKNVLMLAFKVKATGSDVTFDSLNITDSSTGTLTDVIGEYQLKNGSDVLATIDGSVLDGTDAFALDDTFTIDAGSTEVFKIYATVNDSDNFTSGDSVTVNFASFSPEDSNGDVITDTGAASGSAQKFVIDTPTIAKVGTPTLAMYTHTDGTGVGEEDSYKATVKFNVTAPESNPIYVPLDTFAYGIAGNAGVEYTITGGATVTSASVQYSGNDDLSGMTEANTYRIDAGSTQEFTLNVFLKGNDANGKVAMTSLWYELSDTTPNGTPEISGLSNIYTPLVPLAK